MNATEYLVQAAEKVQSHFIFVSTDFIFSGENGPYDEEAEAAPVNFYGETKLIGENLVKKTQKLLGNCPNCLGLWYCQ